MEKHIEEFIKLVAENPEMPVKLMVDNDTLADDYAYTKHEIKSIKISDWIEYDEKFFTDIDDYIDDVMCWDENLDEKEVEKVAHEKAIKVILIKTGA